MSSESKWQRPSGIVLLLPHGYEGQGPEHSSGRVERFLQACAEDNLQVCNLTTPAQYFHVLRRQVLRMVGGKPFHKPLVIMTPKSLLRSELAVSRNDDFTAAGFQEIIHTPAPAGAQGTRRVILCTGKVYYDLLKARDAAKADDVALVSVEQLYPLNTERLREVFAPYTHVEKWVWCQEESQNMGAWSYIAPQLDELLPPRKRFQYAGRNASASPAVGAKTLHDREQKQLVAEAFAN